MLAHADIRGLSRAEALAKVEALIDRALEDSARRTMTSLILRDDCDLDAAVENIEQYNDEHREEIRRLLVAALDDHDR